MLKVLVSDVQSVKPVQLDINAQVEPALLLPKRYMTLGVRMFSYNNRTLNFTAVRIMETGSFNCIYSP